MSSSKSPSSSMASSATQQKPSQQQQAPQQGNNSNSAPPTKRPSRWTGFGFNANNPNPNNAAAASASTSTTSSSSNTAKPDAAASASSKAGTSAPAPTPAAASASAADNTGGSAGPASSSSSISTSTPSNPPPPSNIVASQDDLAKMHDKMLLLMANLIGHKVRCTLRSGIIYTGILSAVNDADLSLCIKLARLVTQQQPASPQTPQGQDKGQSQQQQQNGTSSPSPSSASANPTTSLGPPKAALVISAKDVIDIYAENVSLDSVTASSRPTSPTFPSAAAAIAGGQSIMAALNGGSGAGTSSTDTFRTDTDISAAILSRDQRELKRWGEGDPALGDGSLEGGLESGLGGGLSSSKGGKSTAWDQFATNEKLFGTKTNYEDELYTTKLDRSGADYQAREQRAAKLAKEILSGAALNSHVAEERGINPIGDDSGMDEEDKYSGVQRGTNAYVPPGARRALAGQAPPPKNAGKPAATPSTQQQGQQQKSAAPASSVVPASNGLSSSAAAQASKDVQLAAPAAPTTTVTAATPNPAAAAAGSGQVKEDLVGDFKKFVSNEKEKLTQKRSQLEKQSKDKRMAELKQFSQSFVLKMPVPADLVPILAKDENKQKEIANRKAAPPVSNATVVNAANMNAPKPASTHTSPNPQAASLQQQSQQTHGTPRLAGQTPAAPTAAKKASQWALPSIPPFDPAKAAAARAAKAAGAATSDAGKSDPSTSTAASKFNVAAKEFVFRPTAGSFVPGGPAAPASGPSAATPPTAPASRPSEYPTPVPVPAPAPSLAHAHVPVPENPFFGARIIRNNNSASFRVKEDFSPFKRNEKIADPATVQPSWGFTGKTYKAAASYSYPSTSTAIHAISPQPSHALPAHLQHGVGSRPPPHGVASPPVSSSQISHLSRTSSSQGQSNAASTAVTSGASSDDGGAGKSGIATPVPSSSASTSGAAGPSQQGMQMHPQAMHMVPGQPQMIPQGFVLQHQPGQPYPTFRYAPGGAGVPQTPVQGQMQPGQAPHQAMVHQHQQQLQQLQQQMQGHQPQGSQGTHILVGPNGQPISYAAHGQLVPMPFSPSMHGASQPMFSPQMANQMPPGQHFMQPMFVAQPNGPRGQVPQMAHGQHPQHIFYSQMQASPGMHQQFLPMGQHQGIPMGASPAVYEQAGQ